MTVVGGYLVYRCFGQSVLCVIFWRWVKNTIWAVHGILSKDRLIRYLRDFDLEIDGVDIVFNRARHLKEAPIRYGSLKLESP
jgi:hypothetical protein